MTRPDNFGSLSIDGASLVGALFGRPLRRVEAHISPVHGRGRSRLRRAMCYLNRVKLVLQNCAIKFEGHPCKIAVICRNEISIFSKGKRKSPILMHISVMSMIQ